MPNRFLKNAAWIRFVAFILGIVILNEILCFLFVPAGNFSRWVLHDVVTPENSYDLIAFGASECIKTWDSQTADAILGTHSFNMGSSATHVDGGIYATFQNAMAHQKPERVIFILGRYEMVSENESPQSYIVIEPYLSGPQYALSYFLNTVKMGGALKRLFPWSEYHIKSWKDMKRNIEKKTSEKYLQYDVGILNNKSVVYRGQGFWPSLYNPENIISYDNMDSDLLKPSKNGRFGNKEATLNIRKTKFLKKMMAYCKKNDCDVVVLMAPIPITTIFSYPSYDSYSNQLREVVEKNGGTFYDMNYAKKDLWEVQDDYYYDASHINEKGAKSVTEAICSLLQKKDNGEDTSGLFYNSWEEYLSSIDHVVATYMVTQETDDKISAVAYCVTGMETKTEYKFVIYDIEKQYEKEIIQEFDAENEINISKKLLSDKSLVLRVYARAKGEKDENGIRYFDYR